MTLTTTTWPTIRDQMATKIRAITPTYQSGHKFDRAPRRYQLRDWAQQQGANQAVFRAFEIVRGEADEPAIHDPSGLLRRETVTVTVAYPNLPGLYGVNDLDDMEKVIRSDGAQIRDALFSSGNYVAGQQAALPLGLPEPDRGDDAVWFQSVPFSVLYYESQTLV